jgi:uncharacterized protein YndB with AHSA1/START domain
MTVATIKPAPVRKSLTVPAAPARAFEVFTAGFGRWWPASHSIGDSPLREGVLECRPGGRWYGSLEDGTEAMWGEVLAWDPPGRVLLAWRIGADWKYDPSLLTEVEVTFAPDGGGTLVTLEHRKLENMGEGAGSLREAFESDGGWMGLLRLYASAVA